MNLSEIDLSDLPLDTIGNWPLKTRVGIIIGSTVIFFILGYYVMASQQSQQYSLLQERQAKLKKNYQNQVAKTNMLDQYRLQNTFLKDHLESEFRHLQPQNSLSRLLEVFSKEAAKHKLTYREIRPLEVTSHSFYMEQAVALSLVGDYHRFGHFIASISQLEMFVTVHDFVIRKREGALRDPLFIEMVVKTYWQKSK